MYQLRETLFDRLDSFDIRYSNDQKFFKYMEKFDLYSIEGKENPHYRYYNLDRYALSNICINFVQLAWTNSFSCSSNPGALVESTDDTIDGLETKSEAQKWFKFLEIETIVKSKLNQFFFAPSQRRCLKKMVLEF